MLFRNDIFMHEDQRYRLLYSDSVAQVAWAIAMDAEKGFPESVSPKMLAELEPAPPTQAPQVERPPTEAMLLSQARAMTIIGDLPSQVPGIFDASIRSKLISARSASTGYSRKAIYKNLRRFWVGGQVPSGLLAKFNRCGKKSSLTEGRGRKTSYGVYQLTERDHGYFREAIEAYFKDRRSSIEVVYINMVQKHFNHAESTDGSTLFPFGERPTVRQLRHFLHTHYSLETQLRNRKGSANFNRDHRAVLGTVMDDCVGVAHYYECDATVGDVLLVSESDPSLIVGKPTIYFIVDRRSRLIVGFYAGFENASWVCAMQAAFSIAQDKQVLCETYGVKYEPTDWPAHEVFPSQMLFDHGEGFTYASNRLAENMAVTVANPPALRADWKPIVESRFKFLRQKLQGGVYGFVVPEDAKQRRNNTGVAEREACLTLKEFIAIFLNLIIAHNRTPMKNYAWGPGELATGMMPTPINIWNHDIANRSGIASRYTEEFVRMSLLPTETGTITQTGLSFRGCYYACRDAIALGLFVKAGSKGAIPVKVTFDSRLVDTIHMHHPNNKGQVFECNLTSASERFRGLSLAEVLTLQTVEKSMKPDIQHLRDQVQVDYNSTVKEIQDNAKKRLTEAGVKKSRTSRKASIKGVRAKELTAERNALTPPTLVRTTDSQGDNVVPFPIKAPANSVKAAEPDASTPSPKPPSSIEEMVRRAQESMMKG